jgi:C1A family cysteine protease
MDRAWGRRRDFNDHRDRIFKLVRSAPTLPLVTDMNEWEAPAYDQGNWGSCTSNAGAGVARLMYRKVYEIEIDPSRAYIYDKERILEGSFPKDDGAQMRSICQVLTQFGFPTEGSWPYNYDSLVTPPTPTTDEIAKGNHEIGAYHRVISSQDAYSILGDPTPWPVLIGFSVYESFDTDQVANTGIMPVPKENEQFLSGHAVYAKGYDMPNHRFLCRNSWGASWGLNGDFWMPAEILDRIDTDMWILHLGGPWRNNAVS